MSRRTKNTTECGLVGVSGRPEWTARSKRAFVLSRRERNKQVHAKNGNGSSEEVASDEGMAAIHGNEVARQRCERGQLGREDVSEGPGVAQKP